VQSKADAFANRGNGQPPILLLLQQMIFQEKMHDHYQITAPATAAAAGVSIIEAD
jgi:hypothetical protein